MKKTPVRSKTTGKRLLILAALLILAEAEALLYPRPASTFQGDLVKNPDEYRMDARIMNGSDSHVITLKASDTLRVHFEPRSGQMKLEIFAPDGSALYSGDGTACSDFDLNLPEDGEYRMNVAGENASGELLIRPVR